MRLKLTNEWDVGPQIGGGGFGKVYTVTSLNPAFGSAVAKLVPKAPGTQRELLFVNLDGIRNVIPIIDSGETDDFWIIIMPKAEKSLRQHMTHQDRMFDVSSTISILTDIATALADLEGKVVHRDLKPENVLLLNETWCLADFGISRYAEATTASDTQKYAMSASYAAPERWRSERATGAADIYALGVIGYELLSGSLPFPGPHPGDFRDQHLHSEPSGLSTVSTALASLIAECLYKSVGARPGPADVLARLQSAKRAPTSPERARLQHANLKEVARQGESARQASENQSDVERRESLFRDSQASFKRIGDQLKLAIIEDAPTAIIQTERNAGWTAQMGQARLIFTGARSSPTNLWGSSVPPAFDVITHSSIAVRLPPDGMGYQGREHSLWFCDATEAGKYSWFETAFMFMPLIRRSSSLVPFAMDPDEGAAKALGNGMAEYQLAWPFTSLSLGDLNEFIDRWIGVFADAAESRLRHPSTMPERQAEGSWRQ